MRLRQPGSAVRSDGRRPPGSLVPVSVAVRPLFEFDNSFVRDLRGLYEPWRAAPAPAPRLLVLNEELATELGVDADALRAPDGVAFLVGNATTQGASPVAQAYAGHQFGRFSPRLGDGRALAGLEVGAGGILVPLPLGVRGLAAGHFRVRVHVEGDHVIEFHGYASPCAFPRLLRDAP